MILNSNRVLNENDFTKKTILSNFKLLLFFEFLVNIYTFHLAFELIIIPISSVLLLMGVYSNTKSEFKPIQKVVNGFFSIFGLFIVIFAIIQIRNDFNQFSNWNTLKAFTFPIILTISFLPFIYLIALKMKYDNIFLRLKFLTQIESEKLRHIKMEIFKTSFLNLRKLKRISDSKKFNELQKLEEFDEFLKRFK